MQYRMKIDDNKILVFHPGQPSREVIKDEEGVYEITLVTGQVKLADGSVYPAVLGLDETSSGEHWETYLMKDGRLLDPHDPADQKVLGKKSSQIFPYAYNYKPVELTCVDHHVNDRTGWSRD